KPSSVHARSPRSHCFSGQGYGRSLVRMNENVVVTSSLAILLNSWRSKFRYDVADSESYGLGGKNCSFLLAMTVTSSTPHGSAIDHRLGMTSPMVRAVFGLNKFRGSSGLGSKWC